MKQYKKIIMKQYKKIIMKQYSKQILEAINRGIRLALDDYEEEQINKPISPQKNIIKRNNSIKWVVDNFVNLGLPSGTLWAKYNLGANWNKLTNKPKNTKSKDWYGDYYAWGETEPNKGRYDFESYDFCIEDGILDDPDSLDYGRIKYKATNYNEEDQLTTLLLKDDIAYISDQRMCMPTDEQFNELLKYTNNKWISGKNDDSYQGIKGLGGRLFISKINGNQLFIPAAGQHNDESYKNTDLDNPTLKNDKIQCWLWLSNHEIEYPMLGYCFFSNSTNATISEQPRYNGFPIRPVLNR